jgi:condensin complex subunit 1
VWGSEKGQTNDLNKSTNTKDVDELEQVAGTAEDDTGDRISKFCDDEMLYGDRSLLAIFGPMIVHICGTPKNFKVRVQQNNLEEY